MKKITQHYYWLDTIRAFAAILVLLVHVRGEMFEYYVNLLPSSQNLLTILFYFICGNGLFGVILFFILSGFLVGGINIQRFKTGQLSLRKFLFDRIFRIGVPLTGAILLIILTNTLLGLHVNWGQLAGQYVGLQFIVGDAGGVFWTLAYEIWFYIILFTGFLFFRKKETSMIWGLILFCVSGWMLSQLNVLWFFCIFIGLAAFYLKDYKIKPKNLALTALIGILAFGAGMFSHQNSNITIWNVFPPETGIIMRIIIFGTLAILISQAVNHVPSGKIQKAISFCGDKLAKFSYSLFLTHYQLIKIWMKYGHKFNELNFKTFSIFIVFCLGCIIFAYIFHLIFEKNTKKIQSSAERMFHKMTSTKS